MTYMKIGHDMHKLYGIEIQVAFRVNKINYCGRVDSQLNTVSVSLGEKRCFNSAAY